MTVPDPTAPTAEDVIARAIHEAECGCGDYEPHDDDEWYPKDAATVVAAVRAMSPETLAELIGGTIEDDGWTPSGPTFARVVGPWQETPSLPVVAPRV